MQGAKTVFLIDAIKTGGAVGTIHSLKNNEIDTCSQLLSSHEMGIAQALKWGRALNELPDNILFYGIEIDSLLLEDIISEKVKKSIEKLVPMIEQHIINIASNDT